MAKDAARRVFAWCVGCAVALAAPAARGQSGEPEMPTVVFADEGRLELGWYPAALQLNPELTRQYDTGGMLAWHVTEGFAIQARFGHRLLPWLTYEGEFAAADRTEGGNPPFASSARWSALLGTELTPLERTGTLLSSPAGFELIVSGGLGASRLEFGRPTLENGPVSRWYDTGLHFSAGVGLGMRVRLGNHVSVRIEVTDVFTLASVSTVEGCAEEELAMFDRQLREGRRPEGPVSSGCDLAFFQQNDREVPLALTLMRGAGDSWLQTVSGQLGVSVLF